MPDPVWVQAAFQGRNDDGGLDPGQASYIGSVGDDWEQDTDTPIRIRFVVQQTNAGKTVSNQQFDLYQNYNGGGYAPVTSVSTEVQLVNDANGIADNATTQQDIGSGTYTTGDSLGYDDGTTDDGTGNCDFAGAVEAELEFCVEIVSGDVADGNTILFEVRLSGGGSLDTYSDRPLVTVNIPDVESTSSSSSVTSSSSSSSSVTSSSSSSSSVTSSSSSSSSVGTSSSSSSSSSVTSSSSSSSSLGTSSSSSSSSVTSSSSSSSSVTSSSSSSSSVTSSSSSSSSITSSSSSSSSEGISGPSTSSSSSSLGTSSSSSSSSQTSSSSSSSSQTSSSSSSSSQTSSSSSSSSVTSSSSSSSSATSSSSSSSSVGTSSSSSSSSVTSSSSSSSSVTSSSSSSLSFSSDNCLFVTGNLTPDWTGTYLPEGFFEGRQFFRMSGESRYIWQVHVVGPVYTWILNDTVGSITGGFVWSKVGVLADPPTGVYSPGSEHSGNPSVDFCSESSSSSSSSVTSSSSSSSSQTSSSSSSSQSGESESSSSSQTSSSSTSSTSSSSSSPAYVRPFSVTVSGASAVTARNLVAYQYADFSFALDTRGG